MFDRQDWEISRSQVMNNFVSHSNFIPGSAGCQRRVLSRRVTQSAFLLKNIILATEWRMEWSRGKEIV